MGRCGNGVMVVVDSKSDAASSAGKPAKRVEVAAELNC